MKLKNTIFLALMLLVSVPTLISAQTTEGKDFWVTFMQADQDDNNQLSLSLTISSRYDCSVTVSNPFTGYSETKSVLANVYTEIELYSGSVLASTARSSQAATGKVCYSVNSEKVDTCALRVTATQPISLFASSYKKATFDATNVLPTASLQDNYLIQTYTPSDHGMDGNKAQGSHFAVIATEDNTVFDYYPTVPTCIVNTIAEKEAGGYVLTPEEQAMKNFKVGDKLTSPVLMAGQVYYVWTGKTTEGDGSDLSGTRVEARDGKKIAVFQGCPHTNIPFNVKERDHIFSQAMPTKTWGNTFAITASQGRNADVYRIMALNDGTEVYVDGQLVHTFDFANGNANDKKQFYEFELVSSTSATANRTNVDKFVGTSHMVTTSCPCALHQFMCSKKHDNVDNGDPAMLWINPIEQQIDEVTFATYSSKNGATNHNVNIVTEHPNDITLDGVSIADEFQLVTGSTRYYFARHSLGTATASHTLKAAQGGFIAHVYGFTSNESYAYSAGGSVASLEQFVTINGEVFTPESNNSLCGQDTIEFACDLNYVVENITWNFGDGSPMESGADKTAVKHFYPQTGDYNAYVLVKRVSSNLCNGQLAVDSIPIKVHIGRLEFAIVDTINKICDDRTLELYYQSAGSDIKGCTFTLNDKALANGFTLSDLQHMDGYFKLTVPAGAPQGEGYSFQIKINSGCGEDSATVGFSVPFDPESLIVRRWNNVFVAKQSVDTEDGTVNFVSYRWFKDGEPMEGENSPVLNLHEGEDYTGEYKLQVTSENGNVIETCPLQYTSMESRGEDNTISLETSGAFVENISGHAGDQVYFCTTTEGTAQLFSISGKKVGGEIKLTNQGGYVTLPTETGMYVLRIKSGNEKAALKVLVY